MNYGYGKWVGYGYAMPRQILGYIDRDEFFRDGAGVPIFRIDGQELYDMTGRHRGTIDSTGSAANPRGCTLFCLRCG